MGELTDIEEEDPGYEAKEFAQQRMQRKLVAYLTVLSSVFLPGLQRANEHRTRRCDINLGACQTQKAAGPSKVALKDLSLLRAGQLDRGRHFFEAALPLVDALTPAMA